MQLMLRNRSTRAMADHASLSSPKNHIISSFLGSPRFFNDFISKNGLDFHQISDRFSRQKCCESPRNIYDHENLMSPNSILETKQFSKFVNPFGKLNPNLSKTSHTYEKLDSEGIGLAIIDSTKDRKHEDDFPKPNTKMVLFGSKLKVQIPLIPTSADTFEESPTSPADFGIKTRNSHILSPLNVSRSKSRTPENPRGLEKLSLIEMERSEDYTCVVTHGPNPKTIHIFDDCIVDGCCSAVELSQQKKIEHGISRQNSNCQPLNFLRFCHACKNKLQEGKDIYMYRGEMAFCSHECRCQEMLSEKENNSGMDY